MTRLPLHLNHQRPKHLPTDVLPLLTDLDKAVPDLRSGDPDRDGVFDPVAHKERSHATA